MSYDSTLGRWDSEDPIAFEGGDDNLSRYVGNDPTNFTDPTGLWKEPWPLLLPPVPGKNLPLPPVPGKGLPPRPFGSPTLDPAVTPAGGPGQAHQPKREGPEPPDLKIPFFGPGNIGPPGETMPTPPTAPEPNPAIFPQNDPANKPSRACEVVGPKRVTRYGIIGYRPRQVVKGIGRWRHTETVYDPIYGWITEIVPRSPSR